MSTNQDQETIGRHLRSIQRLQEELTETKEERNTLREEVAHYRAAVSAVKWLWDQAQKQREFQL